MNKADSERLAGRLAEFGLLPTNDPAQAQVIVLNSCAVRQSAEQRVLSKLGSLRGLKRNRPDTFIALAGCMVGSDQEGLRRQLPWVDALVPAGEADALMEAIRAALDGHAPIPSPVAVAPSEAPVSRWVPVIYGCNQFCTYCIVPYRRGRERSRPPEEIEDEVRRLATEGAREVTLLGQNVDAYGRDLPGRADLADLLALLNQVDGLVRLRFLTSHPRYMTDRLIEAVAELAKVCEHINLPVQSGDDAILRAMHRGYTARQYRELVQRIRGAIPGVSLSTDVIVGFPGESEAQFQATYHLLAELDFDVVHAAMYSPRPGTAASHLPDSVPPQEKKHRLELVEALQERIAAQLNAQLVGTTVEVLVEGTKGGRWYGRTRTHKLAFFGAAGDWRGKLVSLEVTSATAWSLQGRLTTAKPTREVSPVSFREPACRS